MNISKRDKYLLIGVLTLLVGVLYYTILYTNQVQNLETARQNKANAITEYNKVVAELETLNERKGQIKELTASSVNMSKGFYPKIIQEKLILEINEIMEKSGLKGSISFNPITSEGVEYLTPTIVTLPDSTLKPAADVILAKNKDAENKSDNTLVNNNENNTTNEANTSSSTEKKLTEATCEQFKVSISYKGTYEQLMKFKLALEKADRKITSTSLTVSSIDGQVTGTISFEFFAVPKIDDADKDYPNWTINNIYGTSNLFDGTAIGAYSSSIENINKKEQQCDFVGMIKSPSSIYPTVTFGRANDEFCATYVYNHSTDKSEVELIVSKDEATGKYYYKYSTGNSKYPNTVVGNGNEFTPSAEVIKVKIESEARVGSDDKSKVNLKVVNNTDKSVEVEINSDDTANPRVELSQEGGQVYKK